MFDVSVILPNYNHGHFLADCLKAIFSQSAPPREVLVIDDGSKDNSLEILEGLKNIYPRMKILPNKKNKGIHESVNRGIFAAESEYLAFCSADDFVFPGFFERCKEAFALYPDAGICFGDYATFRTGESHKEYRMMKTSGFLYVRPEMLIDLIKNRQFAINSYVAVCRRDLSRKFGGYKKNVTCLADVFFCYQIAFENPIVYVPHIFASQRIEPETYSQKIRRNFKKRSDAWANFLKESIESENKDFMKNVIGSRLLGIGGYFILVFLLTNPRYLPLLPSVLLNVLARKFTSFFRNRFFGSKKGNV